MGKTYGVYIDDPLDIVLDFEVRRRLAVNNHTACKSIPKLIRACVQQIVLEKRIAEVELGGEWACSLK